MRRSRRNSHLHSYYQTWKGQSIPPGPSFRTGSIKNCSNPHVYNAKLAPVELSRQICSPNGAPGSSEPGVSFFYFKNRTKSHEVRTSDRMHETENILIMRPSRLKSYLLIYINEMRKSLLTFII